MLQAVMNTNVTLPTQALAARREMNSQRRRCAELSP